jgi:hypothetical protein
MRQSIAAAVRPSVRHIRRLRPRNQPGRRSQRGQARLRRQHPVHTHLPVAVARRRANGAAVSQHGPFHGLTTYLPGVAFGPAVQAQSAHQRRPLTGAAHATRAQPNARGKSGDGQRFAQHDLFLFCRMIRPGMLPDDRERRRETGDLEKKRLGSHKRSCAREQDWSNRQG